MSLLPIWVEALIVAGACGVIGGAVLTYGHNRYEAGKADSDAAHLKVDIARADAATKAARQDLRDRQAVNVKLLEAQNENTKLHAELDAARTTTAAAVGRLQQRTAAVERSAGARPTEVPGSAGFSTPVTAIGVALSECSEAYRQLALDADADRAAGLQCERHADALSGQHVVPDIP